MSSNPKVGIEAVMATKDFLSGMAAYMAGIDNMNAATEKVANTMGSSMAGAGTSAGGAMEGLNFKSMALAVTLGNVLAGAIDMAVGKFKELAGGAMEAAGRAQEMDYVLQLLGNNSGTSYEAIKQQVEGIKELGITTSVAQDTLAQFMRYEWDTAKATDLARVAQDAAVLSQSNSSDTLQRLIWGIQTMNTEVMRTAGIVLPPADIVMGNFAKTIGKTAGELSVAEKQQAMMNAVIEAGIPIQGAYEAAMGSASKQWRSFERDIYEVQRVMGQPFQSASLNVVMMLRETAQAFTKAMDSGGVFYDLMINLGAIADMATGWLRDVVKGLTDFVTGADGASGALSGLVGWFSAISPEIVIVVGAIGLVVAAFVAVNVVAGILTGIMAAVGAAFAFVASAVTFLLSPLGLLAAAFLALGTIAVANITKMGTDIGSIFSGMADEAGSWGANIIISLANGIIAGVVAVIDAIAYVGSIIAGLLSPGSPPKFLPDLEKWGAAAMTVYMNSWKQGDFSVFNDIAGIVSKFLKSVSKDSKDKGLIPQILGSREAIAEAINAAHEAGGVTEEIMNTLMSKLGPVSKEFKDYIRSTLEMDAAQTKLYDAQKELNAVSEKYDAILADLNAQLSQTTETYDENQRLAEIQKAINTGLLTTEEKARLENEKKQILLKQQIRSVQSQRDIDVKAAKEFRRRTG